MQPDLPAAILWDLDGTLLDTEHLWFAAEVTTMAGYGATWTAEDQRHCLGGPLERVAQYMAERVHDATSDDLSGQLLSNIEHLMYTQPAQWQPGVIPLLQEILRAQIPMALVTASHRRLVDALANSLEVSLRETLGTSLPIFAATVAGDEVNNSKPHPEPYLLAARVLGVSITDCVVIEDSPTGVESGVASGAFVIAVPHMAPVRDIPRGMCVSTLSGVTLANVRSRMSGCSSAAGNG